MRITREDLGNLTKLISTLKDKQFNIQTQYKFLVLSKKINEEQDIYRDQLDTLLERYAEKDENGNYIREDGGIKISKDKLEECRKQITELNNLLITLPDIYFDVDELSPLELTYGELELLSKYFMKI